MSRRRNGRQTLICLHCRSDLGYFRRSLVFGDWLFLEAKGVKPRYTRDGRLIVRCRCERDTVIRWPHE